MTDGREATEAEARELRAVLSTYEPVLVVPVSTIYEQARRGAIARVGRPQPQPEDTMHEEILPPSTDLTGTLRQFHAERQLERAASDFPFRGIETAPLAALRNVAQDLIPHLRAAVADNVPAVADEDNVLGEEFFRLGEVAKLGEEGGEALKAYLRWCGISRKRGELGAFMAELADVVIGAAICAELVEGDLPHAIEAKLEEIYSRGWADESATA